MSEVVSLLVRSRRKIEAGWSYAIAVKGSKQALQIVGALA